MAGNALKELTNGYTYNQLKNLTNQMDILAGYDDRFGQGLNLTSQILQANKAAIQLKSALASSYNINTGNINLTEFSKQLRLTGKQLPDFARDLSAIGIEGTKAFTNLAKSVALAERPLTGTSKIANSLWGTLGNTVKWQASSALVQSILKNVASATSYVKQLDSSLNSIQIVTNQSAEYMSKFAKQANIAAKQLNSTTNEYTKASLIYYQQGLNNEEVMQRANTTIKLANVTGQSAKVVSDQLTAVWNNFYDGSKNLEFYADAMAALGATTASSSTEIAKGLEKFAAIGKTTGLSFEYASSALATVVANTRQSADTVGTSFRTLFSRLQGLNLGETLEDGTTLNKYSKALLSVGVNIKQANGELKTMDTILNELGDKWQSLAKDERIALAQTVGGVRNYTGLMSLMDNWDDFVKNLDTAKNAQGTLQQQAEIYAQSWEAASARVRAASETIYSNLLDDKAIKGLVNTWASILNGVGGLTNNLGGFTGTSLGITSLITNLFSDKIASGLSNGWIGLQSFTKKGRENISEMQNEAYKSLLANSNISSHGVVNNLYKAQTSQLWAASQETNRLIDQGKIAKYEAPMYQQLLGNVSQIYEDALKQTEKSEATLTANRNYDFQTLRTARAAILDQASNWTPEENTAELVKRQSKIDSAIEARDILTTRRDQVAGTIRDIEKSIDNDKATLEYYRTNRWMDPARADERIHAIESRIQSNENRLNGRPNSASFGLRGSLNDLNEKITSQERLIDKRSGDLDYFKETLAARDINGDILKPGGELDISWKGARENASNLANMQNLINQFSGDLTSKGSQASAYGVIKQMVATPENQKYFMNLLGGKDSDLGKQFTALADSLKGVDGAKDFNAAIEKAFTGENGENKLAQFVENLNVKASEYGMSATEYFHQFGKYLGLADDKDPRIQGLREEIKDATKNGFRSIAKFGDDGQAMAKLMAAKGEISQKDYLNILRSNMQQVSTAQGIVSTTAILSSFGMAVSSGTNAVKTLRDESATASQKISAVGIAAGSAGALFGTVSKNLNTFYNKEAQALTNVGKAGLAFTAIAAVTEVVYRSLKAWRDNFSDEGKVKTFSNLVASNQQLIADREQDAEQLKLQTETYNNSLNVIKEAQAGSTEYYAAQANTNELATSLIEKYNLQYGTDWFINEEGVASIYSNALKEAQEQADKNVIQANQQGTLLNLLTQYSKADQRYNEIFMSTKSGGIELVDENGQSYTKWQYKKGLSEEEIKEAELKETTYDQQRQEALSGITSIGTEMALQFLDEVEGADLIKSTILHDQKNQSIITSLIDNVYNETVDGFLANAIGALDSTGQNTWKQAFTSNKELWKQLQEEGYIDKNLIAPEDKDELRSILIGAMTQMLFVDGFGDFDGIKQIADQFANDDTLKQYLNFTNWTIEDLNKNLDVLRSKDTGQYTNAIKAMQDTMKEITDNFLISANSFIQEDEQRAALIDSYKDNLTLSELQSVSNLLTETGSSIGKPLSTFISKNLISSQGTLNKDLLSQLSKMSWGTDLNSLYSTISQARNLSNFYKDIQDVYDLHDFYNELIDTTIEGIGGEAGLFNRLYHASGFQDVLTALQDQFDSMGEITADNIVALTKKSEELQQTLGIGKAGSNIGFTASGLAAILTAINRSTLNANQISSGFVKAMSTATQNSQMKADALSVVENMDLGDSLGGLDDAFQNWGKAYYQARGAELTADTPLRTVFDNFLPANVRESYYNALANGNGKNFEQIMSEVDPETLAFLQTMAGKKGKGGGSMTDVLKYFRGQMIRDTAILDLSPDEAKGIAQAFENENGGFSINALDWLNTQGINISAEGKLQIGQGHENMTIQELQEKLAFVFQNSMGYSYKNANSLATIYAGWYAGTSGGVQMEGAAADKAIKQLITGNGNENGKGYQTYSDFSTGGLINTITSSEVEALWDQLGPDAKKKYNNNINDFITQEFGFNNQTGWTNGMVMVNPTDLNPDFWNQTNVGLDQVIEEQAKYEAGLLGYAPESKEYKDYIARSQTEEYRNTFARNYGLLNEDGTMNQAAISTFVGALGGGEGSIDKFINSSWDQLPTYTEEHRDKFGNTWTYTRQKNESYKQFKDRVASQNAIHDLDSYIDPITGELIQNGVGIKNEGSSRIPGGEEVANFWNRENADREITQAAIALGERQLGDIVRWVPEGQQQIIKDAAKAGYTDINEYAKAQGYSNFDEYVFKTTGQNFGAEPAWYAKINTDLANYQKTVNEKDLSDVAKAQEKYEQLKNEIDAKRPDIDEIENKLNALELTQTEWDLAKQNAELSDDNSMIDRYGENSKEYQAYKLMQQILGGQPSFSEATELMNASDAFVKEAQKSGMTTAFDRYASSIEALSNQNGGRLTTGQSAFAALNKLYSETTDVTQQAAILSEMHKLLTTATDIADSTGALYDVTNEAYEETGSVNPKVGKAQYNEETGEMEYYDENGNPITMPTNTSKPETSSAPGVNYSPQQPTGADKVQAAFDQAEANAPEGYSVTSVTVDGATYVKDEEEPASGGTTVGMSAVACFAAGTQILMADGSLKNIEDVKVNEIVLSYDEENQKFVAKKVFKFDSHHNTSNMVKLTFDNNEILQLTASHPLYSTKGWKSLDIENAFNIHGIMTTLLEIGDIIIGYNKYAMITNIEYLFNEINQDSYNIDIEDCHTYLANGFITHNKRASGQNNHTLAFASGKEGEIAVTGELGPELRIKEDGTAELLGKQGREYAWVEPGDRIYTAAQTASILGSNNIPALEGLAKGISNFIPGYAGDYQGTAWNGSIHDSDNTKIGGYGGSGGGEEEEKDPRYDPNTLKIRDILERYYTILQQLNVIAHAVEHISKVVDRGWGQERIQAIQEQTALYQKQYDAQVKYVQEIRSYTKTDKEALTTMVREFVEGYNEGKEETDRLTWNGAEFDENGVLTNYKEFVEKLVEQYNANAEENAKDKEAQYKFQEQLKDIQFYTESLNLLMTEEEKLYDLRNQILDNQVREVSYRIEYENELDNNNLRLINYELGKVKDNAYEAAEAIALIGQQSNIAENSLARYEQGIWDILKVYSNPETVENMQKAFFDDPQAFFTEWSKYENNFNFQDITTEHAKLLEGYMDNMIVNLQTLQSNFEKTIDFMGDNIKEFSKTLDKEVGEFDYFGDIQKNLKNILDLTNRRQTNVDSTFLAGLNADALDNSMNKMKATKRNLESMTQALNEAQSVYQKFLDMQAADTGEDAEYTAWLQRMVDKTKKNLDTVNEQYEKANKDWLQSWEDALSKIEESYKQAVEEAGKAFEESFSPFFTTLDLLQAQFDREKKLQDLFVDDYQRIHDLSKLNRDIEQSILDTDNLRSKSRLRDLQKEINQLQADGTELSEYDLDILDKKYKLELARQALEDAKDAKSLVRLSRDNNGNWGYVYTSNEDEVAKAEQDYEDAIREMEEANENYIANIQDQIVQVQQEAQQAIQNLQPQDFETYEDYLAAVQNIQDSMMTTLNYLRAQLNGAFANQDYLDPFIVARYGENNHNLTNDFGDLILSKLLDTNTMDQVVNDAIERFNKLTEASGEAFTEYSERQKEVWETAGYDIQNAAGAVGEMFKEIADQSNEQVEIVEQVAERIDAAYAKTTDAIKNQITNLQELTDHYETFLEKVTEFLRLSGEYIPGAKKDFNETIDSWEEIAEIEKELAEKKDLFVTDLDASGNQRGYHLYEGNADTISQINAWKDSLARGEAIDVGEAVDTREELDKIKAYLDEHGIAYVNINGELQKLTKDSEETNKLLDEWLKAIEYLEWLAQQPVNTGGGDYYSDGAGNYTVTIGTVKVTAGSYQQAAEQAISKILTDSRGYSTTVAEFIRTSEQYKGITNTVVGKSSKTSADTSTSTGSWAYQQSQKSQPKINYGPARKVLSGGYTGRWQSALSGMYTGEWPMGSATDNGRWALLHQKELVLNAHDTENFLDAMEIVRQLDNLTNWMANGLGSLFIPNVATEREQLEQNVHIDASFPNVQDHREIEMAFDNIVNLASQYANRK